MEQSDEKLNFTRQEIEQHLQSALAAATPNVWEKLDLSVPQDKPQKVSKVLRLERRLRRAGCAAACICLLAGGGIYHYEYMQVDSVIGIDVNPSLRISLNRREKVLKAEALNPDGEIVLDKKLQGESLESALGQVVDSLVEKGYLKEGQKEQAILVSVSGKNKKKAEKVKTEAAANVEDSIAQKQVSAVVYDQTIQVTKELEELAQSYQVSVGKASFIEQLVQENESLSQDVQASYTWMMNQSMESITQEISENEYSVSEQVNVIQVEPAAGASKSKRDKPSRVEMDTKSVREDEETQKERENTSGSGREEEHSLTKEEDRLEAGEADEAKEQTGDEDKDSREKSKQPAGQKETEAEDSRKDKQNREDADADKDKANPEDRVSKGQDAEEEGQNTKGEATSSTVGAENPGKETAEATSDETTENADMAEDEPEITPEDKADSEKGHPEETIADETPRIPLVEYSQPVKDREEQEDLVVGSNLFNGDSSNQEEGVMENLRPEDGSGDVKAPENPEAGENTQESTESPEAGENTQESTESPEAGENTQESTESPEAGENTQESTESPEAGENEQESAKSPEAGENTEESAENQKTDEREDREVSEEAGSQEVNHQESVENSEETVKSQETAKNPETGENPEDAAKDQESAADSEGIEKGQEPDSHKTDNQETSKQKTDNQETSNQEINKNPEETAKLQEAGREETREEKAGEEQQKEGNLTATQIIRVKVEKKEWKEPEKPVLASQFLGFSHRRLLSRGPGAFDFIVVNPEELMAKKKHSKELSEEEVNEDQEWDEDTETDKEGNERFPEAEEEEAFGETAEEWEAEMGEWLHFGPGYLERKE